LGHDFNIMGERSMSMFRRFVKDDSGATAIEYGLIAALVSVAIIITLGALGDNLNLTFTKVSNSLAGAAAGGATGGTTP
jgi:pilus assembly protein Flp/PilA